MESNGVVSLIIGSQIIPTVFPYAERTNIPLFDPLGGRPGLRHRQEPDLGLGGI